MPPSPPPVAHTGKKLPTFATALVAATSLPAAAANSVEGTAASRNHPATNTDGGTLQGKTFVEMIHAILAMPNYCAIISWNDAGTVVIIHDVDAFMSTIMPAHFKKSKLGSFIRRMRRWGFSTRTKKHPVSTSGQITTVVEFSSEHFLRDQPDLCLLMKDERQMKKKFAFLDRNVRKVGLENNSTDDNEDEGSSVGVCFHYPPSSSKIRIAKNQPSSSMMLKSTDTGHGDLHVDMKDGYDPQNYSQENSMPSKISPNLHSFHSAMPMVHNMMSPYPPPLHYPPYGYDAPPPPPPSFGLDFGPTSPAPTFQYPAPDGYPPYQQQQQQQQQQHQMMQRNHHHHQQQQYYQMMQQNQQYPPPHMDQVTLCYVSGKKEAANDAATSTTPNGDEDVKASTARASASASAAFLSSSSEETTEMDLSKLRTLRS